MKKMFVIRPWLILQEAVLRQIVQQNRATAFGRDHEFSTIQTLDDFRKQLPVLSYADHQPYIERSLHGEGGREISVAVNEEEIVDDKDLDDTVLFQIGFRLQ